MDKMLVVVKNETQGITVNEHGQTTTDQYFRMTVGNDLRSRNDADRRTEGAFRCPDRIAEEVRHTLLNGSNHTEAYRKAGEGRRGRRALQSEPDSNK